MDVTLFDDIAAALKRIGIGSVAIDSLMAIIRSLAGNAPSHSAPRQRDAAPNIEASGLPRLSTIARRFHRDSLRRCDVVGTPIEDASWNMMLAIYADAAEGGITSTTSACYASGVPATTALRHIDRLCRDGLLIKEGDPFDRRRTLLAPTSAAVDRMEMMIRAFCIPRPSSSP